MSKKKFKKIKEKKSSKEKSGVYSGILALLEEMVGKAYSTKQITRKLGIKKKSLITDLYRILDQLEEEGKIQQLGNGTYRSARESVALIGKVDHVNPRFAYVAVEGEEKDIYIKFRDTGSNP